MSQHTVCTRLKLLLPQILYTIKLLISLERINNIDISMSLHTGEPVTSNMSFFLSLYCRKCQVKLHYITLMLCGVWAITHGSQRHDTRPFSKSLQPTALSVWSPKQLLFQWNVNLKNWFALVQPLTSNPQCILLKKSGACLVIATISGLRKNTLWHIPRGVLCDKLASWFAFR